MHEFFNNLVQSFFFLLILPHNHELYQGVAPPGLTYLTHRQKAKTRVDRSKHNAMHMCVCLTTLNLRPII